MSDYAFVAERAKKTFASVARLESRFESNPDDRATEVNLAAMRKMAAQAREELERLAAINHIEICEYRMIPSTAVEYGLLHVSKTLFEYQNLFTQIYDALKNGKKTNTGVGRDAEKESSLDFAYTYSGSLGFAFLARSERGFFSGNLDTAIEALYQIIAIDDADTVRDIAQHLGRAVIKRTYDWSKANVDGGFSADVRWKRSDGRLLGQVIDIGQMKKIVDYIDDTSDERRQTLLVEGILLAVSLPNRSFQIAVPNGPSYSGHFGVDLKLPEMTVGRLYKAEIMASEITYYATQYQKLTYVLSAIRGPINDT